LAFAVAGCKEEPASSRQVTKKISPGGPKGSAATTQEVAKPEPASESSPSEPSPEGAQEISAFQPKAKRDPFKSFVTTTDEVRTESEKKKEIKTPLQRYSLDQLKVVGIIGGGNVRKALVEDDVGKGYVVVVGDVIGTEGGEISSIEEDRIIVQSTYRDVLGNKKVRRITKKLYTLEEGENP
jgi:Tfp pilus assembly protein PilP